MVLGKHVDEQILRLSETYPGNNIPGGIILSQEGRALSCFPLYPPHPENSGGRQDIANNE